jgi:hypothetical protein
MKYSPVTNQKRSSEKLILTMQMYQKKLPEFQQNFEGKKSVEIRVINKNNIYQQCTFNSVERIKINTFVREI